MQTNGHNICLTDKYYGIRLNTLCDYLSVMCLNTYINTISLFPLLIGTQLCTDNYPNDIVIPTICKQIVAPYRGANIGLLIYLASLWPKVSKFTTNQ